MSASHWDGVDRAPLRVGIAAIVAIFTVMELAVLPSLLDDPHFRPARDPWLPITPLALCLVGAAALAALAALAANRRPLTAALAAMAAMAQVSLWGAQYFKMVSHNFMFPGGLLFGWALGLAYARTLGPVGAGRARDEELAEAGAMGVFAALYVGSALSKLLDTGTAWVNPHTLRFLVLSQQGVADLAWIHRYRALLVEHPNLAYAGSVLTLVVEGGSFFLLVSRTTRTLWGALILLLHLNITALATMPYIEPMAFAALFTLPWPRLLRLPRTAPARSPAALSWPVVYGLLLLLFLAALLPEGASPFATGTH